MQTRMKTEKLPSFDHFEEGVIDIQFSKVGLERINVIAEHWTCDRVNAVLRHKHNSQTVEIASLCHTNLGDVTESMNLSVRVEVASIELMRLDEITDDMAVRAGVERQTDGNYKHYSPELFYPKKLLKTQPKGSPSYSTAKGSFFSLWAKRYGVMEIYRNPWVWCYTFKLQK